MTFQTSQTNVQLDSKARHPKRENGTGKKINVTAGPEFWHQRNGAK